MKVPGLEELLARYAPTEEVGTGAFGVVHRGVCPRTGQPVALKVLDSRAAEGMDARFRREAQGLLAVRCSHVVHLRDLDLEATPPFLVMEWVGGGTLDARVARGKVPLPAEARRVTRELLTGLAALHAEGFVHRDLKPANILLREDGAVVLADLGMIGGEVASSLSATGQILGTPRYMPPEVLKGKSWSPRGDLFAAGVVLWEFATGRHPAARHDEAMTAFLDPAFQLPDFFGEGAYRNPALERALRGLLEISPDARPADATAALDLLGEEADAREGDPAALEERARSPQEATTYQVAPRAAEAPAEVPAPGARTREALPPRPATEWQGVPPDRRLPRLPRHTALLGGVALGVALFLVTRQPAPPGVVLDDLPPPPGSEARAFPPGYRPGLPRIRHAASGKIELAWETPVPAYATGVLYGPSRAEEAPRGASNRTPRLVVDAPARDEVWRDLDLVLVDREGTRAPVAWPEDLVLRNLRDDVEAFLASVEEHGPSPETRATWKTLEELFVGGGILRELGPATDLSLFLALGLAAAEEPAWDRARRRRVALRQVDEPPTGRFENLGLEGGRLPADLPDRGALRLAAWTGVDVLETDHTLAIEDVVAVRIHSHDSPWVTLEIPAAWLPRRELSYRLHAEGEGPPLRELRLYR